MRPSLSDDLDNERAEDQEEEGVYGRGAVSDNEGNNVVSDEEEDDRSEESGDSEGEVHMGEKVAWARSKHSFEDVDGDGSGAESRQSGQSSYEDVDDEEEEQDEPEDQDQEEEEEEEEDEVEDNRDSWNIAAQRAAQDAQRSLREAEQQMKQHAINRAEEMMSKARSLYMLGTKEGYVKAVECFTAAISLSPPDWDGQIKCTGNRSACYMMQGNMTAAIEDCKNVRGCIYNNVFAFYFYLKEAVARLHRIHSLLLG
jgi:hypothetical protein